MMKNKIILTVLTLMFGAWELLAQGCSQCRMLSEQQSSPTELDESAFSSNINYGIMYLMIIPYLLIMFLLRKQIIRYFKKHFGKKTTV